MGFQAEIAKGKGEFKGKSVIKTTSYVEATNNSAATHLKTKAGSYELINSELIVYKRKGDTVEEVNYLDVGADGEATYFINTTNSSGEVVEQEVDSQLYSQVVVMGQNANGNFYRCTDGRYIHKDEIQIPAYKKVETSEDVQFAGPVRDGQFYVGREDDVENRKFISHVMVGDKIVDIGRDSSGNSKVNIKQDGSATINVNGEEVEFGERNVKVGKSSAVVFRETSGTTTQARYYPVNAKKVHENSDKGTKQLDLRFADGDIERVYVTGERTEATIHFRDGHKEVYLQNGKQRSRLQLGPNDKVFRVSNIEANYIDDEKGYDGRAYDIKFSEKVEVDKADLRSIVNDENAVTDIVWEWDDEKNFNVVKSYKIGNETVSDIVWEGDEIKSFTVTKADGSTVKVDDAKAESARDYRYLIIKSVPVNEITDIEFKDDKVSFKLDAITIRDAEIVDGRRIGKCTLIYEGKEYKTDLQKDARFKKLDAEISLRIKSNIIPLAPSKLLEKVDGKYQVVADVVQTGPILTESEFATLSDAEKAKLCGMTEEQYNALSEEEKSKAYEYGATGAHTITGVEDALKRQEDFRSNPFKTIVIDDKNPDQIHELDDFKNKYEGTSEFQLDPKIIPKVIGGGKIEVVNGRVVIDSKNVTNALYSMSAFGFGVCGYLFPFGMLIGIPMVGLAAVGAVAAPIYRAIKAFRISHLNPEKLVRKIQKNAEKLCAKNIRKYDRELRREIRRARKLPGPQYQERVSKLKQEYENKCQKEIGKLQVTSKGLLNIPFDLNKKSKLTNENVLGFLFARKQEKEFIKGDKEKLKISKKAYRKEMGLGKRDKIDKEEYKNWKLGRRTDEYLAQHGSLKQKLKLFKNSDEYRNERSLIKRHAILKAKRDELLADARVAKPIEFKDRTDRKGNSLCEKYSNTAYSHVQEVMETAETKSPSRLRFRKNAKMPENSVEFKDTIAHKVERTDARRLEYDARIGEKALEKVETLVAEQENAVKRAEENVVKAEQSQDFEQAFKAQAENYIIAQTLATECRDMHNKAHSAPYSELNEPKLTELGNKITDIETSAVKSRKQARSLQQRQRAQYEKDVERWAMSDLVSAHKKEFETFIAVEHAKGHTNMPVDVQIMSFKAYLTQIHPEKKDMVNNEMQIYKIKNNVETRVQAEVVCEQEEAQFQAWLSKHPKIDPKSEIARCSYYAYRVKQDVNVANQFKIGSGKFKPSAYKACQQKTTEMFNSQEQQMESREEKQKRFDKLNKVVQEKRAQEVERKREEQRHAEETRTSKVTRDGGRNTGSAPAPTPAPTPAPMSTATPALAR